jgi:hypothetical protein
MQREDMYIKLEKTEEETVVVHFMPLSRLWLRYTTTIFYPDNLFLAAIRTG